MPTSALSFYSSSTSVLYLPPGEVGTDKGNEIRSSREKLASVYKQKIKIIKSESSGDACESQVKCYRTYVKDLNDQIDVLLSLLASTEQQLIELSQSKNKPWYGTKNVRTQCELEHKSQSQLRDIGIQCASIKEAEKSKESCRLGGQESQFNQTSSIPNCDFPRLKDIGTQWAITNNDNQQTGRHHNICPPKCLCQFENKPLQFNKTKTFPNGCTPRLREIGTTCADIKTSNDQAGKQHQCQPKKSCKLETQPFNQINTIPNCFIPSLREIGTQCAFIENTNQQAEGQHVLPHTCSCQLENQAFISNQIGKTPNCCIPQLQEIGKDWLKHKKSILKADCQNICLPKQSKSPTKNINTDHLMLFSSRDPKENIFSAILMGLMNDYHLQTCLPQASSTCQSTCQPTCPQIDHPASKPSCKQECPESPQLSCAKKQKPQTQQSDCEPQFQSTQLQDWKSIVQALWQPESQPLCESQPPGSQDGISTDFASCQTTKSVSFQSF